MVDHGSVDDYIASTMQDKEVLSDPNKNLTVSEIRLGKGKSVKMLTKTENFHEKIFLGDLYKDKEFLRSVDLIVKNNISKELQTLIGRSVFHRAGKSETLKELSEGGFLFLTQRSEFWRSQRPIYSTKRSDK